MNTYRHHILGFFSQRAQAEKAFAQVTAQGIAPKNVQIFDKYSVLPTITNTEPFNVDKKQTWASANLNSLAGTGLGSLIGIKLVGTDVSLIVERSLIPPLVALGWGMNIGVVGINFYNREEPRLLSDLVHDAILSRQIVVLVETRSQDETAMVNEIIQEATGSLTKVI